MSVDAGENKRMPKRPMRDWESAVEKQLREAMERGEFDDLPGRGKPLDLSPDPHTPDDLQIAFKLLKDAGIAPDWIELDKEIREQKERIFEILRSDSHRQAREPAIAQFRKQADALNKMIDTFNLKAPATSVHHTRIQIEQEIEKFLASFD